MKRNFNYMNNQRGFIFPFTLMIVTIIFLVLLTFVSRFNHERIMTQNIQQHYIFESLFSLAETHKETSFTSDNVLPDRKVYEFPQGRVTMTYTPTHSYFNIQYTMTLNNGKEYSVYQAYPWDNIMIEDDANDLDGLHLRRN